MKDIGVSTGMKLKQEVEKDPQCNPFKEAFQKYNVSVYCLTLAMFALFITVDHFRNVSKKHLLHEHWTTDPELDPLSQFYELSHFISLFLFL